MQRISLTLLRGLLAHSGKTRAPWHDGYAVRSSPSGGDYMLCRHVCHREAV